MTLIFTRFVLQVCLDLGAVDPREETQFKYHEVSDWCTLDLVDRLKVLRGIACQVCLNYDECPDLYNPQQCHTTFR